MPLIKDFSQCSLTSQVGNVVVVLKDEDRGETQHSNIITSVLECFDRPQDETKIDL